MLVSVAKQTGLHIRKSEILVLIDFSLTVKAATLLFISGRGSAFLSAKQGISGSIYNLGGELISCLGRANVCAFLTILHTELTFVNP